MAVGVVAIADDYQNGSDFLMAVSGFHATFGLLCLSLVAPTVLGEERVRGSLDVLLTTPLATDRIVLSKWWGAYRVVPALALLPAICCLIITAGAPDQPAGVLTRNQPPAPLATVDRIAYVCIPVAMVLAQGAVVTSVGLALATWIRRVGRAVAVSVTCCAVVSFGWIIVVEFSVEIMEHLGLVPATNRPTAVFIAEILATACPLGSQMVAFTAFSSAPAHSRIPFYIGEIIVLLATIGFALVVLALTLVTFDRCVGRVSERPGRVPRPPCREGRPPAPHAPPTDSRQFVSARPGSAT